MARALPPVSEAVNAHENIYIGRRRKSRILSLSLSYSVCVCVCLSLFLSSALLVLLSFFSLRASFVFYPPCWLVSSPSFSSSCTFAIRFQFLLSATLLFRVLLVALLLNKRR